jgi:hypothetical protein
LPPMSDNGSMVHLDNERPFMLFGDNGSKSSKDFYFSPPVGTDTPLPGRCISNATISHAVSFRVCRGLGVEAI